MSQRRGAPRLTEISRRRFLAGSAGLVTAALLPYRTAAAAAPYSFTEGDFEIIVISDGSVTPPPPMLQSPDAPAADVDAAFEAAGQVPGQVELVSNVTLVRAPGELIVFDTGSGPNLQPSAGKLFENLAGAGIDPASVTRVVFTHAHPDHVWGTLGEDGGLRFPNATYYTAGAEWDFWMDPGLVGQFPSEFQVFVTEAQRHLNGVKDRVTMLKPGDEVIGGVGVLDTAGHTPGHISLQVGSEGGVIIVADALVFDGISFQHPDWRFGMDTVQDLAATARRKLLDQAATDRIKLVGFHWPYPGVGHAERDGSAYRYVPAS